MDLAWALARIHGVKAAVLLLADVQKSAAPEGRSFTSAQVRVHSLLFFCLLACAGSVFVLCVVDIHR